MASRHDRRHLMNWRSVAVIVAVLWTAEPAVPAETQDPEPFMPPAASRELIERINRLYSEDRIERLKTIRELQDMGPAAALAAPFLVNVLSDRTVVVVPDRTILGSHEEGIALRARDALVAIGSAAVPVLQAAVRASPDANTRALAAEAMHIIIFRSGGRPAGMITRYQVDETCIALWLVAMKDPDERVRRYATEGIARSGTDSCIPALVEALADAHQPVRQVAVEGVARLKAKEAVDTLIPMLAEEPLRVSVQKALGTIGAPAVGPLVSAIGDEHCTYRDNACWALYRVRDPEAIPLLHEALRHDDPLVRKWAASALAGIRSPLSLEPLSAALADADPPVRSTAAWALGHLRYREAEDRATAAGKLAAALREDDRWEVRQAAAASLGRLRPLAPAALKALREARNDDENARVREIAAEVLAKNE